MSIRILFYVYSQVIQKVRNLIVIEQISRNTWTCYMMRLLAKGNPTSLLQRRLERSLFAINILLEVESYAKSHRFDDT